jgi:hypothetical protein
MFFFDLVSMELVKLLHCRIDNILNFPTKTTTYYSELAEYAGTIAENLSPLYFLSANYKRITLSSDSVLFDYLQGECKPINDEGLIILPFDFNQNRIRDIVAAL